MRWVNSMRVFTLAECCKTVPLHSGQWFPQPAPAPVARTSVPHRITAIKYAKTAQAKRRKAAEGDLCAFFEAAEIVMEASRPPISVNQRIHRQLPRITNNTSPLLLSSNAKDKRQVRQPTAGDWRVG